LTINGEKLEELQAEAILNLGTSKNTVHVILNLFLVKGIEDDATTVNDESEAY